MNENRQNNWNAAKSAWRLVLGRTNFSNVEVMAMSPSANLAFQRVQPADATMRLLEYNRVDRPMVPPATNLSKVSLGGGRFYLDTFEKAGSVNLDRDGQRATADKLGSAPKLERATLPTLLISIQDREPVPMGKKSARRVRRALAASRGSRNKQPWPVMALDGTCPHCQRPQIEIDHYGERLIGCVKCNRWGWPGSSNAFMALREEDLQALSNLSDARHKAEDTTP